MNSFEGQKPHKKCLQTYSLLNLISDITNTHNIIPQDQTNAPLLLHHLQTRSCFFPSTDQEAQQLQTPLYKFKEEEEEEEEGRSTNVFLAFTILTL